MHPNLFREIQRPTSVTVPNSPSGTLSRFRVGISNNAGAPVSSSKNFSCLIRCTRICSGVSSCVQRRGERQLAFRVPYDNQADTNPREHRGCFFPTRLTCWNSTVPAGAAGTTRSWCSATSVGSKGSTSTVCLKRSHSRGSHCSSDGVRHSGQCRTKHPSDATGRSHAGQGEAGDNQHSESPTYAQAYLVRL